MEIPRHWRLKKQRYGLVGEVCPHCDYKIFPPRYGAPCPNCEGTATGLIDMMTNLNSNEEAARVAGIVEAVTTKPVR